jgi:sialate O-acetylesterase
MRTIFFFLVAFVLFTLSAINVISAVKMPLFFNHNMVLQRDIPIAVWGWAKPGEKVSIKLNNSTEKTTADKNGNWKVYLPALTAGGPYELTITGENEIIFNNVLIGDIWLCSGQSNMEWTIERFNYAKTETEKAQNSHIRILTIQKNASNKLETDVIGGQWKEAVGDNILNFSAVAYFFGKHLQEQLNVPIGLINSSWGGSYIEAWMSNELLLNNPDFSNIIKDFQKNLTKKMNDEKLENEKFEVWKKKVINQDIGLSKQWYKANTDIKEWKPIQVPFIFNEMDTEKKNYFGSVWLKRKFDLPVQFWDETLEIRLGKISDYNEVWINGNKVGELLDKDKWVIYDIPREFLKKQDNELVIRILNINGEGGFAKNADYLLIGRKNKQFGNVLLAGTWHYKLGSTIKETTIPKQSNTLSNPHKNPSLLYNGMIYPLIGLSMKGVIWYQGESNAPLAWQYRKLFPDMITDWRKQWNIGEFPFLYVQLANYKQAVDTPCISQWAELREAQNEALKLPNVGCAVTIDIGQANDIHPANKQDVGKRLGLAAEKIAYQRNIVYSGPTLKEFKVIDHQIILTFEHIGKGLVAKNKYGYLSGFSIASNNKVFKWAKAEIINDSTIAVSNINIKQPVAVRYAWADNPDDANLYNSEGLPASPFRTDIWEISTLNEKRKF